MIAVSDSKPDICLHELSFLKQYDVTPEIAKSWIWHYSGHNYNYRMHYRMQKRGHIMSNI
jgi:hypothetical protein